MNFPSTIHSTYHLLYKITDVQKIVINIQTWRLCSPESIEWFIEVQAFLRSYDSATRPLSPPPTPVSKLSQFLGLSVPRRSSFWRERGGGGGAKLYDGEKAWSSINHPILSDAANQYNSRICRTGFYRHYALPNCVGRNKGHGQNIFKYWTCFAKPI